MSELTAPRIKWLDAARGIAIFMVFFGHFVDVGGAVYYFVYEFHVPFFFLISGFMAQKNESMRIMPYILKKAKNLLLPYFAISFLMMFVLFIRSGIYPEHYIANSVINIFSFKEYLPDRSSNILVNSRWFLPAIFFVSVFYFLLSKVIKKKWIRLCVCMSIFLLLELFCNYPVRSYPAFPFALDRALSYMAFYAIGDTLFEPINNFFTCNKPILKYIRLLCFGCLCIYLFVRKNLLNVSLLESISDFPLFNSVVFLINATVLSGFALMLAFYLQDVNFLSFMDRILCFFVALNSCLVLR